MSALDLIDNLVSKIQSTDDDTKMDLSSWDKVIGDSKADDMKKETAAKFGKNKKESNVYKRLKFIQTLLNPQSAKDSEEDQKGHDHEHCDHDHFFKPIDDPLDITRGSSKQIDDIVGNYSISSQADFSLACNFNLSGSGKYYYEVQLTHDPASYKDINIGFANENHSARNEVGFDDSSYGYNGIKNKLYHFDTSYGKTKWKADDVLGFALDTTSDNTKIEFFLNGESQGVAFENVDYSGNLFAGFTLQEGTNGVFIFDETKLKSKKPANYSCLSINSDDIKKDDLWKLEGDIKAENVENGFKISAESGFPTAVLKGIELTANNKYYFEFVLGSGGCMQLGFGDAEFEPDAASGEGIGDDNHSWGCDLLRMRRWGICGNSYCNANWTKDDIIGCCLDLDAKTISYSLNGKDLGVAFKDIDISEGLHPAVSVRNKDVRDGLIEMYKKYQIARQEAAANQTDAPPEPELPAPIEYLNIIFSDKGYKYKPDGFIAITDTAIYKAREICDNLKEYSYEQYISDFNYMDTVIQLETDEQFDEIMNEVDKDTLVVCDFWATWCGPCIYIAPHYHKLSEQYPDVVFLKADVDKLSKLSQEKGINCMPTFKFFKDKKEVHKIEGADLDGIKSKIEELSKKDAKIESHDHDHAESGCCGGH